MNLEYFRSNDWLWWRWGNMWCPSVSDTILSYHGISYLIHDDPHPMTVKISYQI